MHNPTVGWHNHSLTFHPTTHPQNHTHLLAPVKVNSDSTASNSKLMGVESISTTHTPALRAHPESASPTRIGSDPDKIAHLSKIVLTNCLPSLLGTISTLEDRPPLPYRDCSDIFEKRNADRFPEHRPYDCPCWDKCPTLTPMYVSKCETGGWARMHECVVPHSHVAPLLLYKKGACPP